MVNLLFLSFTFEFFIYILSLKWYFFFLHCYAEYKPSSGFEPSKEIHKIMTFSSAVLKHQYLNSEQWKCIPCSLVFFSQNGAHDHMLDHHGVLCEYCRMKFISTSAKQTHVDAEHLWQCGLCNRKFLKTHSSAHMASHPKCSICSRVFLSASLLQQHMAASHYPCEYCSVVLQAEALKNQHKNLCHPHSCDTCCQAFASQHLKRQHMIARHPVRCGRCPQVFASQQEKAQHEAMHTFECDVCHKQFRTEDAREQHKSSVHSYQCIADGCGKWFNTGEEMYEHEEKTHNIWSCTDCNRCFKSQQAQSQHVRDAHQGNFFTFFFAFGFYLPHLYIFNLSFLFLAKHAASSKKVSAPKVDNAKSQPKKETKKDNKNDDAEMAKYREQAERLMCPICLVFLILAF